MPDNALTVNYMAINGDLYSYMVLCMVVNGDILVFVIGVLIHELKYNFC